MDNAFKEIGQSCKAKTPAAWGSGARMAELTGASEEQIRRLGRWNNNAMENCYLTNLPREAMRTLAGFRTDRGCFFIRRAVIEPAPALKNLIFPEKMELSTKFLLVSIKILSLKEGLVTSWTACVLL